MSLFNSALDVVSSVAKMVPGYGQLASTAIDVFKSVMNQSKPMTNSAVDNSTLPDLAKSAFKSVFNAATE